MDWNIEKSRKVCSQCSREFEEGQAYQSALFETDEHFERKDFCSECWTEDVEAQAFSFWKTHVPSKEEERKLLVDNDVLLEFFQRLSDNDDDQPDHKLKFRYILALVLMRKKILRFTDIRRDNDKEYLVLRYPKEDLNFEVLDPGLTEEEADTVKDDLSQILNVEV